MITRPPERQERAESKPSGRADDFKAFINDMEYCQLPLSSSVPLPLSPCSPSPWPGLDYPDLQLICLQVSSALSSRPVLTLPLLYFHFRNTFSNQPDTRVSIPGSCLLLR